MAHHGAVAQRRSFLVSLRQRTHIGHLSRLHRLLLCHHGIESSTHSTYLTAAAATHLRATKRSHRWHTHAHHSHSAHTAHHARHHHLLVQHRIEVCHLLHLLHLLLLSLLLLLSNRVLFALASLSCNTLTFTFGERGTKSSGTLAIALVCGDGAQQTRLRRRRLVGHIDQVSACGPLPRPPAP